MIRRTDGGVTAEAQVVNLGARGVMATGICFLDHMIDQLTSHGQLGVTVRVALPPSSSSAGAADTPPWLPPHEDYANNDLEHRPHDASIFRVRTPLARL